MSWLDNLKRQGRKYKRLAEGEGRGIYGTDIGPGGSNVCTTPGMRIRSSRRGRGLAKGRGRGPIRVPYSPERW